MVDSVTTVLLENVLKVIQRETELLTGVEDEVKSLQFHLSLMRSFVRDAEAVEPMHDTVKALIRRIRELAYDADDILDDYVAGVRKYRKTKWSLPNVGKLISDRNFTKKIQDAKKEIEQVYDKRDLYGILPRSGETSRMSPLLIEILNRRRLVDVVYKEDVQLVGVEDQKSKVTTMLNQSKHDLTVVSIIGMEGLGKTTLAKKVFKEMKRNFTASALVCVSRDFNPTNVLLGISRELSRVTEEMRAMTTLELGLEVRKLLADKRYLMVLDDVWDPDAWTFLSNYLPNENNKSRVLITSRSANVVTGEDRVNQHELRFLNSEESWELFRRKALLDGKRPAERFEELGRGMLAKCRGLPLAIVVLGGLLSNKDMIWQWEKISRRVTSRLGSDPRDDNICPGMLALSYYDLPSYLKPCFLYLGVFPEDHRIEVRQLIHMWVAEGIINPLQRELMEETAYDHLLELAAKSLIIVDSWRSDKSIKNFTIHDLLRELCIREAEKEDIFHVCGTNQSQDQEDSVSRAHSTSRRIVGDSLIFGSDKHITKDIKKKIRSLLSFAGPSNTTPWTSMPFKDFKALRVLHCHGYESTTSLKDKHMPPEIGNLTRLRYLRTPLRICSNSDLTILTKLCNIQTIDLRSTINKNDGTPVKIWKLSTLRHIYTGASILFPPMQEATSHSLPHLQTLSKLRPVNLTNEHLAKMPALLMLHLSNSWSDSDFFSLDHLDNKCLSNLRKLKLTRCWSSRIFPDNLTQLSLEKTELGKDYVLVLEKLSNLQVLKWKNNSYNESEMVFSTGGFPSLRVLVFDELEITSLSVERGGLPILSHLHIRNCYSLCDVSEQMWSIEDLSVIDVRNPTSTFEQKLEEVQRLSQGSISINVYSTF